MSRILRDLSHISAGRGVGLKNVGPVPSGRAVQLGRSPGPGTGASLMLFTNFDTAYESAVISFYVQQFGRRSLFATTTVAPTDVLNFDTLVYTASGFAADYWECEIQLAGGTPAAEQLRSSIIAFGVEDNPSGIPMFASVLSQSGSFTGPAQASAFDFTIPAGLTTWLVVVQMRILSSGVDPVGDSASTESVFAWKNIGGIVTLVPVVLNAPNTSQDALMSTFLASVGSTGTQAQVLFTTPSGLNASSVVKVTVTLFPVGNG